MVHLKFREIKIEDIQLVNSYLAKSNFMGSEYSFPVLFIWRHKYNYRIAEHGGFLIVAVREDPDIYYFYPPGDGNLKETVQAMYRHAEEKGLKCYLTAITGENVNTLEQVFPGKFRFSSHMDYFDYIYEAQDLINLSGQKYKAKRNHINRFIEEYGEISYEDITSGNIEECIRAYSQWLEDKKDKGEDIASFSDETVAMKECFKHYMDIGLMGGIVRARGNLCSFTFGSRINSETLGVHIEKSLIDCQGGYAVINREFARKHAAGYKYINREEDLGIKGLRQAKLSYHPVFLLEKHTAILKDKVL